MQLGANFSLKKFNYAKKKNENQNIFLNVDYSSLPLFVRRSTIKISTVKTALVQC
jgi:hypothetical protein